MHYANGRAAHNGDVVLQIVYGTPVIAILYDAVAGNDYCNGKLAAVPMPAGACLADCIHIQDLLKVLGIDLGGASTVDIRKALSLVPHAG
jgi:hypothetical protein